MEKWCPNIRDVTVDIKTLVWVQDLKWNLIYVENESWW
jgi:hypothetical protein